VKNKVLLILLAVVLALSVGLIGCKSEYLPETTEYNLAISSTEGGSVTTPREEVLTYGTGTVIKLMATPDPGYQFVNWTGDVDTIADVYDAATNITTNGDYSITANFVLYLPVSAAGYGHTVGLKEDLTVAAVGDNSFGQCDVGSWTDIIQVAAGSNHTVGLKSDGTVVAVGLNDHEQCDVADWTNITYVAAGGSHTVGVRQNGTVIAVGLNDHGQCDVGDWTDIVQVAAGLYHTVGLTDDGWVLCNGDNSFGQCDFIFNFNGDWVFACQIDAGWHHSVALLSNGQAVAWGDNYCGQCNVQGWYGIKQVAAGGMHSVGLQYRGSVVCAGTAPCPYCGQCNVYQWRSIQQIDAGFWHTEGVQCTETSDGALFCEVIVVGCPYPEAEVVVISNILHPSDSFLRRV
jgi:alpha-tubulin suppressor-like RCC1 family protein